MTSGLDTFHPSSETSVPVSKTSPAIQRFDPDFKTDSVTEDSPSTSTRDFNFDDIQDVATISTNKSNLSDEYFITCLLKQENPTDKAHFENINLSDKLKNFIVKTGSCQPNGPFSKDEKKRGFSTVYYKTVAAAGQSLQVKWLNYSKKLDCAYCLPCWLFSGGESKSGWATGIRDWQGLSKKNQSTQQISTAHFSLFGLP